MMLPWSMWLWKLLPFTHMIQYPWRILSIIVIATPVLAARTKFAWIFAVLAVFFAYGYIRPVTYEPRSDAYYLSQESFTKGTNSLGNAFQTIWMKPGTGVYTAPVAYYPGWKASIDGKIVNVLPSETGLLSFPVPEGDHDIRTWLTNTWWQTAAGIMSILSLFTLLVSFILKKRQT